MPHVVVLELTAGKNNFEFAQNIETALSSAETDLQELEDKIAETEETVKALTPECDKSEFMERYMEYIRDRESNIPFSLHDSRILQIEYNKATLTLRVDRIFQYVGDEEKWYQGIIEFTKADIEECDIMLFNRPYGYDGENDPIFGIMRIWNTGDMIYRI